MSKQKTRNAHRIQSFIPIITIIYKGETLSRVNVLQNHQLNFLPAWIYSRACQCVVNGEIIAAYIGRVLFVS